jgi:hypothetical protein
MWRAIADMLRRKLSASELKPEVPSEAKLKHLDFIQGAISRMSSTSSLFKGWAITIATALAGFAAVESRTALLLIALVSTVLFWAMDAYYLWLERGFVDLHKRVAAAPNEQVDFSMAIDKTAGFCRWLRTCIRWHLLLFYGAIMVVDVIGILLIKGGK